MRSSWPATTDFLSGFSETISSLGGKVSDTYDDGKRLFVRSTLPGVRNVNAGDGLQGGVAMRATDHDLHIHPYVFRQVCRNGAIFAQAIGSTKIVANDALTTETILTQAQHAILACCQPDVFAQTAEQMRSAAGEPNLNFVLNVLPLLGRIARNMPGVIESFLKRLEDDGDRSRYGVMNAVTAIARDTRDPEQRWRLEELGGGIAALRLPTPAPRPIVARRREPVYA